METLMNSKLTAFEQALLTAVDPPPAPVIAALVADLKIVANAPVIPTNPAASAPFKFTWKHGVLIVAGCSLAYLS